MYPRELDYAYTPPSKEQQARSLILAAEKHEREALTYRRNAAKLLAA